jgi:hypothetical protein
LASGTQIEDACLEVSKIDSIKMLDLEKKSAINLDNLQVQHQATSQASRIYNFPPLGPKTTSCALARSE